MAYNIPVEPIVFSDELGVTPEPAAIPVEPTKATAMAKLSAQAAPAPVEEKPEEILLSSLSPAEQKKIQDQIAQQSTGEEVLDMVDALSAEELAKLDIDSAGKEFNPKLWASAHPDATPEQTDKVAEALAISQQRGAKFSDIDLWEAAKAVPHIITGAGKFTGRALEVGIVEPIGRAVAPKLTPAAQAEFDAIQAAKAAELTSATESGMFGIAELAKKGAKLAGRQVGKVLPEAVREFLFLPSFNAQFLKQPKDRTPEEKRDALWAGAAEVTQQENITKGHGAVTGTLLAGPLKDLESKGYKVDPEAVAAMAAGDPLTFVAFGKGFQVIVGAAGKGAKVIANVASKSEAGQLVAALNAAQRAAAAAGAAEAKAAGATARALEGEIAGAAQIGKTAFPGQAGVLTAEATPGLSAALQTTAETAAAARVAEIAARRAGEAVAASPAARTLVAAGKLPAAVVEAKAKVGAAIGATAERGIDMAAALAPGVAGVGLKTASWLAKTVGEHPLAAYAIAGGGTAGLGGAGASAVGKAYAPAIGRAGKAAAEAAKQLRKGETREYGAGARAISSAAQMFPAIAGGAARGAVVDAALAAATSETSEDMAHAPMFMTAHGAVRGANIGVLRGIQRQLIGERDIQSASRSAGRNYGDFPSLDAANKFTVDQLAKEQPDKVRRLSAIRDFLNPSGAQLYWIPETGELTRVLRELHPDMSDARIADMASQRALNITVNGKKLAIVKDLDAAPHEAMHPWQEVMSEDAMRVIDEITYDNYAPYWEAIGDNYARKFFGSAKLNELKSQGEGWREAILDLASGREDWRGQLTPEQVEGFSNQYVAREISAEVGDAIFKQGGPELLNDKSFAGKIARIIAKTYSGLGMEPFQGAATEGQGIPLRFEATEKIRKALVSGIEEAGVEAARPKTGTAPVVSPKRGPVSPRGESAPISERTPAASREVAAAAPETPTVSGGRTQRELASDIADAIEANTGVSIAYRHAEGEPAGSPVQSRDARRALVEWAREVPEADRVLFETQFVPDSIVRSPNGVIQVIGWAPEVFAANAHRLAKALSKTPGSPPIPYEMDRKTGTFTRRGWQELYTDTTNFVKNQMAGLTGAGEPLVFPAEVTARGFRAPAKRGEAGSPLDQRKADIISMLFGVELPKGNKKTGIVEARGVYPRNLIGQEVAEATMPGAERVKPLVEPREFGGSRAEAFGVAGRKVKEVNPFRAELTAAKIESPTIEAVQRLNLDRIEEVSALPAGIPAVRGVEPTLQAGFQTRKDVGKAIRMAAVRNPKGEVFEGTWHGEAYQKAGKSYADGAREKWEEGYVTNEREFLGREEAFERAVSLDQLAKGPDTRLASIKDIKGPKRSLEALGFDEVRKFQPGKGLEEAERFAALSPSEFVKEIKSVKRGMTNQAWDLGRSLSLEEVPRLREAEQAARAKWKAAMDAGDMTEAIAASSQKQFFNEAARFRDALEEAKGVTDPAKLREIEQKFGVGDLAPKDAKFQSGERKAEWVGGALKAALDPRSELSVRGSSLRPALEEAAEVIKKGYTEKEFQNLDGTVRKMVVRLADIAKQQGTLDYGAAYYPRLLGEKFKSEKFPEELEKIKGGQSAGQTFNADGTVWTPGDAKVDIVTLASKNIPQSELTPENFQKAIAEYEGVLDNAEVKAGVFSFSKGGAAKVSVDINAVVPQEHRENSIAFAKENNQVSIWDAAKGEEVPTGGTGETVLDSPEKIQGVVGDLTSGKQVKFAVRKSSGKTEESSDLKLKPTSGSPSKGWIMPDGKVATFGGQWHRDWLEQNPDIRKKFGLKLEASKIEDEAAPEIEALQAGLARVNYEPRNGKLTVEARAKDWPKIKDKVFDIVEENLGQVDKLEVHLLDEKATATPVDSVFGNLFQENTTADKLAKVQETIDAARTGEAAPAEKAAKGPSNIAIARARFQSGEELPGFESPPAAPKYDREKVKNMTRQELREHFPEAVIPRAKDETFHSDIVGSPLYKKSKTEAKAVEAFADRLVEFAKEYKDDPAYKVGEAWYSEFTPKMKKEFGDDAPIFAELLAATSPNTPPGTNFKFAYDAIESYKAKRFAKQLPKFHEGLAKLADGSWETWMTENRPDAKQSTQRFMAEWIKEYDLKPRQTNGKLYGLHSTRVLQVFARKWLETTKGPKTRNFVENLIGTSDEATIDLWADRTMRWAGYEGFEDRWRILPEYGRSVSDKDFRFAQKAFKAAADKMGIKSSALQGALWFAEKKRWADKGWGKLDLGSFSTEMEKIPKLKKGFEERMKKETKPLDIQGRFD